MNTLIFKKTMVVATVAIIAIGLAIAPTILTNEAQAQRDKNVQGQGTGTLSCPSSGQVGAQIYFGSEKSRGSGSGYFQINTDFGGYKYGYVTSANINGKHFTLQGIEEFDGACGENTPTTFTLRGTCGPSGSIQFTAANGERGTFTGSVACP